jgi:5'-nucleotidase
MGGMPVFARQKRKTIAINILHTNDVHSQIDPFPSNHARFPGKGGFARRIAYIKKVRSIDPQTLVFDCGDFFQGTPYFNFYKGRLEIELMNRMGIDAVTIGNHEFDNGLDMLSQRISEANFPFVNANYTFNHPQLQKQVKPHIIIEKYGIRIGVFGLGVQLDGLVNLVQRGETVYNEPIEIARQVSDHLKTKEKCDLVIAVTHIGFSMNNNQDDKTLAAQTDNIDIILGGHTHTFLKEPEVIINRRGRKVWVNQVGASGVFMGHLKLKLEIGSNNQANLIACNAANVAMEA